MSLIPILLLLAFNVVQLVINAETRRRLEKLEQDHLSLLNDHGELLRMFFTQALAHKNLSDATHKLANLLHERDFPGDGMGKVVN